MYYLVKNTHGHHANNKLKLYSFSKTLTLLWAKNPLYFQYTPTMISSTNMGKKKKGKIKNIIPFLLWVKLKCSNNLQMNVRPKSGEVSRPMPVESKRQTYQQIKKTICKDTSCLVIKNNSHLVDITIWKTTEN